ncbi:fungal-specific transcription factor domain-containing protein [Delphinella strobiligena]|nr:fungal-specific transcription factor domain-containing protein [Delphinella strobiligena]
MVFALGAIDVSRLGQKLGSLHLDYFSIAITHYLDGLIKADNTQTVQGLLLVGYFAIMESHSVNAWHVAGQAVRVAVDIGLHGAPAPDAYSLVDMEMRKRRFWSAYAIDRNVSVNLGRPSAIRDADITVELPLQLTDDELLSYPSLLSLPLSRPARHDDTSTLIHIIKARKLQSRIQDIFYPGDASAAATTDLEWHRDTIRTELDDWIANVPRFAHPIAVTYQSTEWFQIVYSHSLILLYRPLPASPTTTLPALQICADAAISFINSYSSLYAKNKITYTWLALHGLFMASVTMLYTIWVSPQIRRSTTKAVIKTNVTSCLALFQVMRDFWPLAARCHEVIDCLGRVSVALFDKPDEQDPIPADTRLANEQHFGEVNAEYMDWFGTREATQTRSMTATTAGSQAVFDGPYAEFSASSQSYMPDIGSSMDLFPDLDQLFQQGFDMNIPLMTSAFG